MEDRTRCFTTLRPPFRWRLERNDDAAACEEFLVAGLSLLDYQQDIIPISDIGQVKPTCFSPDPPPSTASEGGWCAGNPTAPQRHGAPQLKRPSHMRLACPTLGKGYAGQVWRRWLGWLSRDQMITG